MTSPNRLQAIEDGVLDILPRDGSAQGVQLGICACIHGDEPVGWEIGKWLCQQVPLRRGRIRLVFGNINAFMAGQRRVDEDLNRVFRTDLLQQEPPPHHEVRRARRILQALEGVERVIDMHSTSGPSTAFLATWDTQAAREFAAMFPILRTVWNEELLPGTLIGHLAGKHGIAAVAIEAGQHTQPETIDNAKAVLAHVLARLGMIAPLPEDTLDEQDFPSIRVLYSHVVRHPQRFRFERTYESFDALAPGELIAMDGEKELRAPQQEGVRIIMPTRIEAIRSGQCKEAYFLGVEETGEA